MARRNHVVMQGKAHVQPPGQDAEFVLTNASLKLIFQTKESREDPNDPNKQIDVTSTYTDHIDASTIEDVDLESATQVIKTYDTVKRNVVVKGFCSEHTEQKIEKVPTGEKRVSGQGERKKEK